MKKYIDEILKYLEDKDEYITDFDYDYKRIEKHDGFELVHYIRELQKENELLKEELKTLKEGINRVYTNMIALEEINRHELEVEEI